MRLGWASALLLAACTASVADAPIADQWRNIAVQASPVELGAARVGRLLFRGGLALSSDDAMFGGVSDLEVLDGDRLVAITDNGDWLSARLELDEAGALVGFGEARLAMMRDEHGEPFARKEDGDSEDLAQLPDGRFAVSFEQTHSIRIYDLNRDGPFGAASAGPPLAGTERLPPNASLEALASDGEGGLVVGAEESGALWRPRLGAAAPAALLSAYPLQIGFALTSLDRLPDGNFVALERFYAPVIGARARLTILEAASLSAGGVARKQELALLAAPLALDNFEGVAVARAPDGGVRLYIISDDNFSDRQRTLIYAFDVEDVAN